MGSAALSFVTALALLLSALSGAATAADPKDPFEALAVLRPPAPSPAPDVRFRSLDGREARLRDLRGKPIVLTFFTTW